MTKMNWEKAAKSQAARPVPSTPTEFTYWWTIPKFPTRCAGCGNMADLIAFRASDQHNLCQVCVKSEGLEPRESRRYREHLERVRTGAPEPSTPKRKKPGGKGVAPLRGLSVKCPACGAEPGDPCTVGARQRSVSHPERKGQSKPQKGKRHRNQRRKDMWRRNREWCTAEEFKIVGEAMAKQAE